MLDDGVTTSTGTAILRTLLGFIAADVASPQRLGQSPGNLAYNLPVMSFDVWKSALIANELGAVSLVLGYAFSQVKLSPKYGIPTAVFFLAFLNLMFLIVRPRSLTARARGEPIAAFLLLIDVLRERPLIALVVVVQLVAVSRWATAAVMFFQLASGETFRSLLNPSDLGHWMLVYSGVMAVVAGVWLASAVGLWDRRSWAWWLALVLNGLSASTTAVLQLLNLHSYLLDIGAIIALALLLLPTVRRETRRIGYQAQHA